MNLTLGNDPAHFASHLLDSLPSMVAYWDRDLRCRFANRAYETWFGVDPKGLIGTSIRDLLGAELFALNEPFIIGALRGERQYFERLVPGPNGVKRHSQATYLPDIVNGEVLGFMAAVSDITPLKEAEASLRLEAAAHRRAFELLRTSNEALRLSQRLGQIGSWEWEIAPDITNWSEELYRIFGRDPSRLPPSYADHAALYRPASWEKLQAAVSQCLQTGAAYSLELEYVRADGSGGWLEARGEALRDDNGIATRLVGTVLDITVRREAQEARVQQHIAEAASHNKTVFLSRVSHELRTPLNSILGFAQLMQIDPETRPKHRKWAEVILLSGHHMLELVDEVLDLSSAELGSIGILQTGVDPARLVADCLWQFATLAADAGVTLVNRLPAVGEWQLRADPLRLAQVMNNLVSNAIKYSPPGSEVTLSAAHLGATIELTVSDTGLGMSDEQLGRLFTPFDRLGAENTGIKGTGVGLALTKLLVDLMGGSICVDSQPGKGSRFVIGFAADAGADPAVARQCAATSATA